MAGDAFNISLTGPKDQSSRLLEYFPDLRNTEKESEPKERKMSNGARSFRGAKATPIFGGFKTYRG